MFSNATLLVESFRVVAMLATYLALTARLITTKASMENVLNSAIDLTQLAIIDAESHVMGRNPVRVVTIHAKLAVAIQDVRTFAPSRAHPVRRITVTRVVHIATAPCLVLHPATGSLAQRDARKF